MLVDFENLVMAAEEAFPALGARAVPFGRLEAMCSTRGPVNVRRAYADWAQPQFGRYQEDLTAHGVELIQVARFGCRRKNAADIRMAVDAMEMVWQRPAVGTFVLVAGDGDYHPLVLRLREYGREVIGAAPEAATSPRLRAVCDDFWLWQDLLPDVPVQPPTDRHDLTTALDLVLRALEAQGQDWMPASALKNRMLALDPDFDQRTHGAAKFADFLALPALAGSLETSSSPSLRVRRRRLSAAS